LNTWESLGGSPPPAGTTGPYHLAIVYPTRSELANALGRLIAARDPDNNGLELYWDRPKETWPLTATGQLSMFTRPLDLEALLRESPVEPQSQSALN
jgi:catechol 2,3-dioxygenase